MRVNPSGNNPVQGGEAANVRETGKAAAARSTKKSEKPNASSADSPNADASATISAKGKEFARAKAVATEAPDVREEKIAELKRRIAAGKYQVNADKVADRMVNEHLSTKLD